MMLGLLDRAERHAGLTVEEIEISAGNPIDVIIAPGPGSNASAAAQWHLVKSCRNKIDPHPQARELL
jgi:hypothetical protein